MPGATGLAAVIVSLVPCEFAQVDHDEGEQPWGQRAEAGPDAKVPGWYYNLGITGLLVELVAEQPTHLVVRHVFADSPASGKVEVGDHLVGAGGARFDVPHQSGYGMEVFGARGPIEDLARALEAQRALLRAHHAREG
jgi:hypothetical protein